MSTPGILPCQAIEALIANGAIAADVAFDPDQVQPASLDLRLGPVAWRVRASFLPGAGRKVADRIAGVAMHKLDLSAGAVLEKGCVYLVEVAERLALPAGVSARANPKSSTGRVDVFVRLLTDHGEAFDDVAPGYAGPLYLEIAPQTFSVLVRAGTRLNQLRLKAGDPPRVTVTNIGVDLTGEIAGYRARRHAGVIDLDREASKGVLEVLSHTPFLLEDGQTVARMVYEPLTERPTRLYGEGGSHYQKQGLKLSKHFRS